MQDTGHLYLIGGAVLDAAAIRAGTQRRPRLARDDCESRSDRDDEQRDGNRQSEICNLQRESERKRGACNADESAVATAPHRTASRNASSRLGESSLPGSGRESS